MKPSVVTLFVVVLATLISCQDPTPPPSGPCDNVGNNQSCLDGQIFSMNVMSWETWSMPSYKFYLIREDGTTSEPGPYISTQVIIYNAGTSGVPELGTYTMVPQEDTGSSAKQMILYTYTDDGNGNIANYYMDSTSVGTFEITSISGTDVSGNLNCKVTDTPWQMGGANSKSLKIKFVNVPYY